MRSWIVWPASAKRARVGELPIASERPPGLNDLLPKVARYGADASNPCLLVRQTRFDVIERRPEARAGASRCHLPGRARTEPVQPNIRCPQTRVAASDAASWRDVRRPVNTVYGCQRHIEGIQIRDALSLSTGARNASTACVRVARSLHFRSSSSTIRAYGAAHEVGGGGAVRSRCRSPTMSVGVSPEPA